MSIKKNTKIKMRFICGQNGQLLKNSPGNYTCGETYQQPYRMAQFPFWEPVEETPELEIPPPSEDDSVFSDVAVFPEEDEGDLIETVPDAFNEEEVNIDPDTPASVDPYIKFDPSTGGTSESDYEVLSEEEEEEPIVELEIIDVEVAEREDLKQVLDEYGVEYNNRAHTPTLRELVKEHITHDEAESEE